ncbi:MAG: hypothetical protein V3R87_08315 [Dehalococcoidia bacterium]
MAKKGGYLVSDFALERSGASEYSADEILAMRVIVEASSRPGQSLRVEDLAKRTNISPTRVIELLHTPQYKDLLDHCCKMKVSGFLIKGVMRLGEQVIDDKKATPREVCDAMKVMTGVYKVMADSAPQQEQKQGFRNAQKLLDELDALNALKPASVTLDKLEEDAKNYTTG